MDRRGVAQHGARHLEMLSAQISGVSYSKTEIRRRLRNGPLTARGEASIEYRMGNITVVLEAHDRPTEAETTEAVPEQIMGGESK